MDDKLRKWRELDVLENIATELMRLRVLKEHELGVRLKESPTARLTCLALTCPQSRSKKGLGSGYPSGCPGPSLCYNNGWNASLPPTPRPSVGASKHTSSARIETCFKDTEVDINNA